MNTNTQNVGNEELNTLLTLGYVVEFDADAQTMRFEKPAILY